MPTGCYDEIDLTPFHKMDVPEDTPEDLKVGFTNTASADGLVQWLINGAAMKVDLRRPTLQKVFDANHTFLANETVYSIDSSKPVRMPPSLSLSSNVDSCKVVLLGRPAGQLLPRSSHPPPSPPSRARLLRPRLGREYDMDR